MSTPTQTHHDHGHDASHEEHGSLKSYIIGFILSIVLTIIPLLIVFKANMGKTATIITIMLAAVVQLLVQLFFFMHIREGEKPRYNVMTLILGLFIVVVIVGGSMWIMSFNSMVQ
ncbi:cytochrome o ubiquinol oxidase subunit IV [Paenibacillus baekrokdamisoli]|uniref:Cytochrome o ubiquinol oxidase subunit IV n=1 Tax=Paenibacillus baekrokdamisoli TaxID=1712516 RepID=A0A3G9JFI9_9BACL|nr:cytochrome o ubiquinol oxidase subunit IV [Paenibacillus baekrokdamisoli]MBB3071293.1 cytochrome o ubiquinol oxidase operon protein cyoD [Paenibacillus baekrokdamisoli]BBH24671.1 cytochrome o ubiquinol oxidase subunit IV [Paenibacillus baekrokdamisoli]